MNFIPIIATMTAEGIKRVFEKNLHNDSESFVPKINLNGNLILNGVVINSLEDFCKYCTFDEILNYFKSGVLKDWLKDMYYEEEAKKISKIDPELEDEKLIEKIFDALNVDERYFNSRVAEKVEILKKITDERSIIDNAESTAFNQRDLADLISSDYKKIYLCGDQFSIPIKVNNMKYIGVLSYPKIKISSDSRKKLSENNIVIRNCELIFNNLTI